MDGIRIKKWKVCRVNWSTHHPCEEVVTGLPLYDAEVELKWWRMAEPNKSFALFPNREKVYRKEL